MTLPGLRGCLLWAQLVAISASHAQASAKADPGVVMDTVRSGRECACRWRTATSAGVLIGGSIHLLNKAWYTQYTRSAFHSFDDSREWLQMDKAGHLFSAYTLSRWGHKAWSRCSTGGSGAVWVGAGAGMLFLTGVEVLDGTSSAWGFSWSDMMANAAGTGLFVGQQFLWNEQRVTAKYSARPSPFAAERPDLLGQGFGERMLKDYNGQTIWLSANIRSFREHSWAPNWLNIAFGYGADGMISATPDPSLEAVHGARFRQYFISADVDLTRIKSRSPWVRSILFILSGLKIPAPALEFRSNGRVLAHGFYF